MWNSVGRSGHHRSRTCNGYDDWDGLSENGHQYKNPITMETRDLSGWDYWHLRKQNRPTEEIPMHLHMRGNMANIGLYADEGEKKRKPVTKQKTAFEKICTADRRYERLEQLSQELDQQLESGELSVEDWAYARKQLDKKLDACWNTLCKLRNWNPAERDEEIFYNLNIKALTAKQKASTMPTSQQESSVSWSDEWLASVSDTNCFKRPLQIALTSWKRAAKMLAIVKQAIKQMEGIA